MYQSSWMRPWTRREGSLKGLRNWVFFGDTKISADATCRHHGDDSRPVWDEVRVPGLDLDEFWLHHRQVWNPRQILLPFCSSISHLLNGDTYYPMGLLRGLNELSVVPLAQYEFYLSFLLFFLPVWIHGKWADEKRSPLLATNGCFEKCLQPRSWDTWFNFHFCG